MASGRVDKYHPGATMHPFDRLLFRRALVFTTLVTVLALGVVVVTDEPLSTPGMRAARLAAFAPALAALGASAALAQARSRGELRALATLGASSWRSARGAMLAGWLVGALAVALLVSPWANASVLFPAVRSHVGWSQDAPWLLDAAVGVRVAASGVIDFVGARPVPAVSAPGPLAGLLAVAPLAAAVPPWVGARLSILARVLGAGLALVLAVVLLHAVAAGRLPAMALTLAALPLVAQSVSGHRERPPPGNAPEGRTA